MASELKIQARVYRPDASKAEMVGKKAGEELVHHAIEGAMPSIDIPTLDPSLGAVKLAMAALELICSDNPPTEVQVLGTDKRTIKAKRRKRLALQVEAE